MRVESQLGIRMNNSDFEKIVTVGNLLDVIQAKIDAKPMDKAA